MCYIIANKQNERVFIMKKYNIDIETDLWNNFKSACAKQGRSMRNVLTEIIKDFIKFVDGLK